MFNLVKKRSVFVLEKVFWKNRKMQGNPKKETRFNQPIILPWLRARAVPSYARRGVRFRACAASRALLLFTFPHLWSFQFWTEFDRPKFVQFFQEKLFSNSYYENVWFVNYLICWSSPPLQLLIQFILFSPNFHVDLRTLGVWAQNEMIGKNKFALWAHPSK